MTTLEEALLQMNQKPDTFFASVPLNMTALLPDAYLHNRIKGGVCGNHSNNPGKHTAAQILMIAAADLSSMFAAE